MPTRGRREIAGPRALRAQVVQRLPNNLCASIQCWLNEPLPEMLITKAPVDYLEWKMASWTRTKDLSAFDPRALEHYRAAFADPARIHAHC